MFFEFFCYYFRNFLAGVEYERNSGPKFFSLYLGPSNPVLAKNNTGNRIFNFLNFFAVFLGIFLLGSSRNGIRDKFFFLSFSAYLIPFWLKIMPEIGFLIFWFFLYFFRNFLVRVEYERNLRLKFFSLFLGLYHPALAKNNAGNSFFNFFKFFAIFFRIFLPRSSMNRILG